MSETDHSADSAAPKPAGTYELLATCPQTGARAGLLHTAHGVIETPIFMPVGTQASVKTVPQHMLRDEIGAQIILGNNYHLFLRPGLETFRKAGGLHKFMAWEGPILTDSGGYQVYSMGDQVKLDEEGVIFRSHVDGSQHRFTPENVVDMQRTIGSDIQMVLDECPPYPAERQYIEASVARTHRWAERARRHFLDTKPPYGYPQLQFGIVQGGVHEDIRAESCAAITEMDFEGNAIGGLSVGEPIPEMYHIAGHCCERLPTEKPRYLMGVGTPEDLLQCIAVGVDMFDCVLPTRNARHAKLYDWDGMRNAKAAKWKDDHTPINADSALAYDRIHSRAYLRHLFNVGEHYAQHIASVHNLHFFLQLVKTARREIINGTFGDWLKATLPAIQQKH